jgi:hypothetical protein
MKGLRMNNYLEESIFRFERTEKYLNLLVSPAFLVMETHPSLMAELT